MSFLPVIGLEIHVQLRTDTKMFCGNVAEYGAPPNTHLCPVCLGLPGALPVLNRRAVELGARAALGLNCSLHPHSTFARKHYFYPDLPKGYQITQHDRPLATGGSLELPAADGEGRAVRIRRVHLEEDTGKSLHDRVEGASALDLNRAGVPLIEIVTEPDLRSPAEARAFLVRLKQALRYLRVSDCSMEEGSLRVDANVSVRRAGEEPGEKTEIKNLNSFGNVERALAYEIARQSRVREAGGRVEPLTLSWDAGRARAFALRRKAGAPDYRYLPEPDLPPLALDRAWVERIRDSLPEMPWARARRLARSHGLAAEHAEALSATRDLADYYEAAVRAGADARDAAGWVLGEVLAAANARGCDIDGLGLAPTALVELLRLHGEGTVSRSLAREVLERMVESGLPAAEIVEREGLVQVRDEAALASWAEAVVREHPAEVARYLAGEERLLSFLIGQVMRLSGGRADPRRSGAVLRQRLRG